MRLVLTGGGTGGHVFPALEVGREAAERGASLRYLGSLRGQEGAACAARGIDFAGFPSEPLWSLRTPRGWRALVALLRAQGQAARDLRSWRPDAVFSTGGYSAGPVVGAARKLGIPYVVHESNSMPGRANRLFAKRAYRVTTVFRASAEAFPGSEVERTGQPIRRELRDAVSARGPRAEGSGAVLVLGGSQGARFLNELAPKAAVGSGLAWIHAAGKGNLFSPPEGLDYHVHEFLELGPLLEAYRSAGVALARAGGTLAEFAAFRLPSVLVPLPTSADDHQRRNALEFQAMGAATLLEQSEATADAVRSALLAWQDGSRRETAERALANWDLPGATARIVDLLREAGA